MGESFNRKNLFMPQIHRFVLNNIAKYEIATLRLSFIFKDLLRAGKKSTFSINETQTDHSNRRRRCGLFCSH